MTHDLKHRSRAITDGPDRAPARAMFKAIGLTDEDLAKPLIGVANTWIEMMPCNFHLRRLSAQGEGRHPRRRRHADRVQHHRRLRRHLDGHRGDEGVADQPRGDRRLDRAGRRAGICSTPSSRCRAATRRSRARSWRWRGSTCPSLMLYGGSIAPGHLGDQRCDHPGRVRGGRRVQRRARSPTRNCARSRTSPVPGAGRLRRAIHRQHDGDGGRDAGHLADGHGQRPGDRCAQGCGGASTAAGS